MTAAEAHAIRLRAQAFEAEAAHLRAQLPVADPDGPDTLPTPRAVAAMLLSAVEKTRIPMILTDPNQPDDPIVFANPAFQALCGYGADELLGRNCRFLQGPGTDPTQVALIRTALTERREVAVEFLTYRRDGTSFVNELFISPVLDADGRLVAHFGIQLDSAVFSADRRALEAERTQLAQMFEQAPAFVALLRGPEHRIERVNPGYVRLIGGRDVVGRTVAEALPDAIEQGFVTLLDTVYRSGEALAANNHRYAVQAVPGGVVDQRSVDLVYQPIRGADGAVAGIFVAGADVTARAQTDERLALAIDATGIGIFDFDPATGDLQWDARVRALFGAPAEDPVTYEDHFLLGLHPADRAATDAAVQAALDPAGPGLLDITYRVRALDSGEERWLAARGQTSAVDGRGVRFVGAVRDVTAETVAERHHATLLALGDRLRDLVDPTAVAFAASEVLGTALGVSRVGYGTIDKVAETITIERDWNAPGIKTLAGTLRFRDYGSYIDDLKRGETAIVADAEIDPRTAADAEALKAISAWSFVNMPLVEQGRSVALFYANHAEARTWSADDLDLMREVAERVRAASERTRAEQALRVSEAQFRAFAQAMPNHVWASHADGNLYWFNDQVYAYSGEATGTLDGATWARILHPDDQADAAARWGRSLSTGAIYETEFRIRRADGLYRWFLVRAEPVRGADGAILRWVGTNTDIDQRRRQAAELARLNETLEAQVEMRTRDRDRMWRLSTDVMLVADFQGRITAVNPAWTTLFGWEPAELLGQDFMGLVHPEDLAATGAEVGTLAGGITTLRFENRYRHRDGSYRWLSWTAVPDEGFIHAVGRDVQAEKEAAEALRLSEEALRQSQKMEAVGQLTGGIAHDFNNLLAGISGSLELMQNRLSQGRVGDLERYMAAAQGASRRAAALTHRLLAFSRRQTLDPKPTDVNRLVAGIEELIRRTVGPAVTIEVVGASGLWLALIDPPQLENALLNLCVNARDAMPDGGRITIETANRWMDRRGGKDRELPPGQYISLCVSDTGTGMSPDIVARAFDPFFTTKPLGKGTGLGLSMIYGFARQSGGQARIYSEVGEGTMVCLYLPRHRGEAEVPEESHDIAEPPLAVAGETVLVVDDEPTVRMLVTEVLEELGYAAVEAVDAASGLSLLRSDARIDLVITDIGLPGGMNGRQMIEAARLSRPGLKALFITGYAENALVGNGQLDPTMPVLTKPFALDALATRIRELIAT